MDRQVSLNRFWGGPVQAGQGPLYTLVMWNEQTGGETMVNTVETDNGLDREVGEETT